MSIDINDYYQKYYESLLFSSSKIAVKSSFHGQVKQVKDLLKNDMTALVTPIMEYMVDAGNVDIDFQSENTGLTNLLYDWKTNVNKNVSIDIPKGLRSFTEQYLRERLTTSLICLKIRWGNVDGYIVPTRMWLVDGGSIYADNKNGSLTSTQYYFGNKKDIEIVNSETESVLIRKPYNQWYDTYPTPYLVKTGTMYHACFKQQFLLRQGEVINTAFPYQLFIKVGTDEAIRRGQVPTAPQLQQLLDQFKNLKNDYDAQAFSKGLAGAFPHDVKFEELIPDYKKVLDEALTKTIDKNLLSSLGMIELKGFSSTREEAILNPKVLVENVNDIVNDYVELMTEVVDLIKEKNKGKYKTNSNVVVNPGVIKAFVTDKMASDIKSWYDRGLVAMEDGLQSTTPLKFTTQVIKRKVENQKGLDVLAYPRVVQNQENQVKDTSAPDPENVPDDKKKNTPEAQNYKNASEESQYITAILKDVKDIPIEIAKELNDGQKQVFLKAFNLKFQECTELKESDSDREEKALWFAFDAIKPTLYAIYKNVKELPPAVKDNMTVALQKIFMNVVNTSLKNGDSEEVAFKKAWATINQIAEKDKKGIWRKKK